MEVSVPEDLGMPLVSAAVQHSPQRDLGANGTPEPAGQTSKGKTLTKTQFPIASGTRSKKRSLKVPCSHGKPFPSDVESVPIKC